MSSAQLQLQHLRQQRLQVVQLHIEAENRHDIEGTLATFCHPRCELVALNDVSDGAAAVRAMLERMYSGFPNLYMDVFTTHHAEDAVIVEGRIVGTQLGDCVNLPASGRVMNLPYVAIFEFEGTCLRCEKYYFDMATVIRQLTGGPAGANQ